MSSAVHVYLSQSDKGEMVMGAGVDMFNSYAQRGSLPIIEEIMAATMELFPMLSRLRMMRKWGAGGGRKGWRAAVTDVSEARTTIRLSGPHARDVLAKGCGLDFHPSVFTVDMVAQSRLARADVILHQPADGVFDIYVARSFAEYLWTWLEDAAGEYGVRVGAG